MYCMEIFLSEDFCGCDLSQQLPWGTGKTEEFPDSSTDIKSGVGCCLERSKITFNCTKTCRTFLIIVLPLQGIGLDWWNAVKTRVYSLPWANNCHSHFQKSGANKYDFYPRFFFQWPTETMWPLVVWGAWALYQRKSRTPVKRARALFPPRPDCLRVGSGGWHYRAGSQRSQSHEKIPSKVRLREPQDNARKLTPPAFDLRYLCP